MKRKGWSGERHAREDGRGWSPMMQLCFFTWHQNGNGGLPGASLGHLLSAQHTHTHRETHKARFLRSKENSHLSCTGVINTRGHIIRFCSVYKTNNDDLHLFL